MSKRQLRKVVAAMCDGEAIDWSAVARRAESDSRRTMSGLALLHALFGERESERSPAARRRERLPVAVSSVMLLAALQSTMGVAGYLVQVGDGHPGPEALPLVVMVTLACSALVLVRFGRTDRRAISLAGFFLCLASAPAQRLMAPLRDVTKPYESGA